MCRHDSFLYLRWGLKWFMCRHDSFKCLIPRLRPHLSHGTHTNESCHPHQLLIESHRGTSTCVVACEWVGAPTVTSHVTNNIYIYIYIYIYVYIYIYTYTYVCIYYNNQSYHQQQGFLVGVGEIWGVFVSVCTNLIWVCVYELYVGKCLITSINESCNNESCRSIIHESWRIHENDTGPNTSRLIASATSHDSFIYETWLIHIWNMTRSSIKHHCKWYRTKHFAIVRISDFAIFHAVDEADPKVQHRHFPAVL